MIDTSDKGGFHNEKRKKTSKKSNRPLRSSHPYCHSSPFRRLRSRLLRRHRKSKLGRIRKKFHRFLRRHPEPVRHPPLRNHLRHHPETGRFRPLPARLHRPVRCLLAERHHLHNRCHRKRRSGRCPYESTFKRHPDLYHRILSGFRIPGCLYAYPGTFRQILQNQPPGCRRCPVHSHRRSRIFPFR